MACAAREARGAPHLLELFLNFLNLFLPGGRIANQFALIDFGPTSSNERLDFQIFMIAGRRFDHLLHSATHVEGLACERQSSRIVRGW